jgi:flagellar hook-associated protein 3 FlgL
MRISTSTIYESGIARISDLQSGMVKTQQQISTGRRILTPADDPVASARALNLSQGQSVNTQFSANRAAVKSSLSVEEGALQSLTSLIQDVQASVVSAGNATYSDTERKFIASEVRNKLDDLMGIANTRDGVGNYIFSGYAITQQPYAKTAGGARYDGDQGQRMVQVGTARSMATNDAGDAIFDKIRTGNGTFVTAADAANTGTGVISGGSVVKSSDLTGDEYELKFSVTDGVTTYVITDKTLGTPVPPIPDPAVPIPYKSGDAITFDGMKFDIQGDPADGDTFSVEPSRSQSMFTTLNELIATLEAPASGSPAGNAKLANGLATASLNLDNMLENVLTVRASVGARLKELDSLDSAGDERNLQYEQTLEDLTGLDFPKAITQLTQQQTTLDAAQKSFMTISRMSLFSLL